MGAAPFEHLIHHTFGAGYNQVPVQPPSIHAELPYQGCDVTFHALATPKNGILS